MRPHALPVPLRRVHSWVVHVETPAGEPVRASRVEFTGSMPEHGHGFPTRPRVTGYIGDGDFLVEGVKFNMAGLWQLLVGIEGDPGGDEVAFAVRMHDEGGLARPASGDPSTARTNLLQSLSLAALPAMPADPSNRVSLAADAASLGRALFFDVGLSANGAVACSTCHVPSLYFTDGLALARGIGQAGRHTPTVLGAGHARWFTWDGRRDSMWSHALTPLEAAPEMGSDRAAVAHYVLGHTTHGPAYRAVFGEPPALSDLPAHAGPFSGPDAKAAWDGLDRGTRRDVDTAFVNVGKALDAYQRTLAHTPSRFDRYVDAVLKDDPQAAALLTPDELAGLALITDPERTQCLRCHNGPLWTNHGFHNIGTGSLHAPPYDFGRSVGLQAARVTPFNCTGPYSDASKADCAELRFATDGHGAGSSRGAFKVPGLRNVAATAPYMHDGRFATLAEVVDHYRDPPSDVRHELPETTLSDAEAGQLVSFLGALTGAHPEVEAD